MRRPTAPVRSSPYFRNVVHIRLSRLRAQPPLVHSTRRLSSSFSFARHSYLQVSYSRMGIEKRSPTNAPSVVRRPGSGRSRVSRSAADSVLLENDCSVSTVQATGALAYISEEDAVDYLSCFGGSSYQTNGNNRHSAGLPVR